MASPARLSLRQADAVERAAELLARARLPIIGGLQTDIAGAQAAIALAKKVGGVIDHACSGGLMRASQLMREAGGSPASFGEVRNRADLVIAVGKSPLEDGARLLRELFPSGPGLPRPGDQARRLVLLGAAGAPNVSTGAATTIAAEAEDLPLAVALLAAAVAERTPDRQVQAGAELRRLAEELRRAAFAVFVYSPAELQIAVQRTILDIVRTLCVTTRSATLAIPAPGNGDGVNLCATWTCGLPLRTSFAGRVPEHDAALYDTNRLIESGESDVLVWIDALTERGIERPDGVPSIVLTAHGEKPQHADDIVVDVAAAGRDHDAAVYLAGISGIGFVQAQNPATNVVTAAEILVRIADLVPDQEGGRC